MSVSQCVRVASIALDVIGRLESHDERRIRLSAICYAGICDTPGKRFGQVYNRGYFDSKLCPYCDGMHSEKPCGK